MCLGWLLTFPASVYVRYSIRINQTREEILKVSMAQNRVDAGVNFTAITAELEGFTGSDIKEVRTKQSFVVFYAWSRSYRHTLLVGAEFDI